MANRLVSVPIEEIFSFNRSVIRSGVIPYASHNNEIHWLIGISPDGKWCDFGGGCKVSKGETAYTCLLREVQEESSGILTDNIRRAFYRADILKSLAKDSGIVVFRARNKKDPVIFRYLLLVPIQYEEISISKFKPNKEVQKLVWITEKQALDRKINLDQFHISIRQYIRFLRSKIKKN